MHIIGFTPKEARRAVGKRAQGLRLALGRQQDEVAAAAGISRSTLLRFENTGAAGFDAVARIAFALGAEESLAGLFPPHDPRSLDEILQRAHEPKRVRKPRARE